MKRTKIILQGMAKPFYVERALPISGALFIVGLGMLGAGAVSLLGWMLKSLGGWAVWSALVGVILFIAGLIWVAMYLSSVRKFNKLMSEKSKAAFVREMDDVEYLAWKLPMKYEKRLIDRKKQFGIK